MGINRDLATFDRVAAPLLLKFDKTTQKQIVFLLWRVILFSYRNIPPISFSPNNATFVSDYQEMLNIKQAKTINLLRLDLG